MATKEYTRGVKSRRSWGYTERVIAGRKGGCFQGYAGDGMYIIYMGGNHGTEMHRIKGSGGNGAGIKERAVFFFSSFPSFRYLAWEK